MRFAFAWLTITLTAEAGVVRGVVSEHISGLPLARTTFDCSRFRRPGVETRPRAMRVESTGKFVFLNVPDGLYLLIATRDPYFPAAYGQRRPEGHGTPIEVTKDSDLFAELRMYRKGAVTGRVLDENGIGMQDAPVIAYSRARCRCGPPDAGFQTIAACIGCTVSMRGNIGSGRWRTRSTTAKAACRRSAARAARPANPTSIRCAWMRTHPMPTCGHFREGCSRCADVRCASRVRR